MAGKDWSATRPFLLKSDLRLTMAVKYWYTIQIGDCNSWFSVKKYNSNRAIFYRPILCYVYNPFMLQIVNADL